MVAQLPFSPTPPELLMSEMIDPKARENMEFLRNSRKISVAGVHRVSGRAVGSGSGGLGIASQRVSPMNQTAGLRTGEERIPQRKFRVLLAEGGDERRGPTADDHYFWFFLLPLWLLLLGLLDRLFLWPSFEYQLSVDCVQFLSSSHCPLLPRDGSFILTAPLPSIC